jgi:predicted anti-sigma-YlaC factor YlaD
VEERLRTAVVCERTRVYVSLEVDGELSEFEQGFLTTHVVHCRACRAYREEIQAVTKHIRETPQEVPARMVRVPAQPATRRATLLARYQLGAAAALAVAVIGTAALVTPTVDREPVFPTGGQETVPTGLRNTNVFSADELRRQRLYGSTALTRRSSGFDFVL